LVKAKEEIMDLSRLKWPLIILIVFGGGWLVSEGGVSFMHNKFAAPITSTDEAEIAKKEEFNEAGLSRLGGFLLKTLRYKKAEAVFLDAVELYPNGKHFYYNWYRLAKCAEKRGDYATARNILEDLMAEDAHSVEKDVPPYDALRLRADKLIETHELGEIGQGIRR
jgi:tetratricopeptide (TPR) repeat protein